MFMSYVYGVILLLAFLYGLFSGTGAQVSAAILEGAQSAVTLLLSMAGPLCLWSAVGELMRVNGMRDWIAMLLSPVIRRLFPSLSENRDGRSALSANITANLLGLGNAATPMGISACQAMNDGSGIATNDQCRLVVLNTASIQLLPTTVAALRSSLSCGTPMDILGAVLCASFCSVTFGLLICKLLEKRT